MNKQELENLASIRRLIDRTGSVAVPYEDIVAMVTEVERLREGLLRAFEEGRNVLPDATDEQAAVIESWAWSLIGGRDES